MHDEVSFCGRGGEAGDSFTHGDPVTAEGREFIHCHKGNIPLRAADLGKGGDYGWRGGRDNAGPVRYLAGCHPVR